MSLNQTRDEAILALLRAVKTLADRGQAVGAQTNGEFTAIAKGYGEAAERFAAAAAALEGSRRVDP